VTTTKVSRFTKLRMHRSFLLAGGWAVSSNLSAVAGGGEMRRRKLKKKKKKEEEEEEEEEKSDAPIRDGMLNAGDERSKVGGGGGGGLVLSRECGGSGLRISFNCSRFIIQTAPYLVS
jgi:hypothetical protein